MNAISPESLGRIFRSNAFESEWPEVEREISSFAIADRAGGVNPGDGRAIYFLVRHFRSQSVLEVGTHIGSSMIHIAAALRRNRVQDQGKSHRVTTVDIVDVNDETTQPWRSHGSRYSPKEMLARMRAADLVTFVMQPSLEYFSICTRRYDFIFLDGHHASETLYRELPAALRLLNEGGVVLLHDYFPGLRPLWPDGVVIRGPWLATTRLQSEGGTFRILPIGELPWPTKQGTMITSLAMIVPPTAG
ncbi:MAG: class I SAM-dependent methyltransferase [Gemmatimonadota bacterium]|nr:class I SAM-dependent methyltransferase [Gemmatimonadota bacterium]